LNGLVCLFKKTLEKTKGAIKNGQSRETGNNWAQKIQDEDKHKTKTQHNTTQKTKKMNTDPTKKAWMNPGAHEG